MAKLNLQIELDKYAESDIIDTIESYIFSYNLIARMSDKVPNMETEICDNSDGTIEIRIKDFEFDPRMLSQDSEDTAREALECLGIDVEELIKNFTFTGDDEEKEDEN